MKKFIYMILCLACLGLTISCSDDEWSNGDPEMDNVYYIGFEDWGNFKNDVSYNVTHGETIGIPMQFYCEFVRDYNVETYYYVKTELQRGTDYEIVDASGNTVQPDANGAFHLLWPNAIKGVQNVFVKALNGNTGTLVLQTFNPNSDVTLTNQDVSTTIQHTETQYEVRIFTQNYKVSVNIK